MLAQSTRAVVRRSFVTLLLMFLVMAAATCANADGPPSKGPIFKEYGPVFDVPEASFPLDRGQPLRVVFDVGDSPEDRGELNRRVESLARYMNMHARAGFKREQMAVALVLHGRASFNALSHEAYQQRFGQNNPNLELLQMLRDQGVEIWLCGQSAGFNDIKPRELSPPVGLALSAMTVLQQLQARGYALLP